MSSTIPTGGIHASPAELPIAEFVEVTSSLKTGQKPSLVLRVNIEGQAHEVALTLDELAKAGMTGPAAVEGLREIRETLGGIEEKIVDLTNAIPNHDDLNGYIDRLAGAFQR